MGFGGSTASGIVGDTWEYGALLATLTPYGSPCGGVVLASSVAPGPGGTALSLDVTGGAASQPAVLLIGVQRTAVPLPAQFGGCLMLTSPLVEVPAATGPAGSLQLALTVPPFPGLLVDLQAAVVDTTSVPITIDTSNGLEVANPF